MNIFFLSKNPIECASFHNNRHCVKMILEYAQLLSTAHHILDGDDIQIDGIYKATHKNHPCAKWVRESSENYKWLHCLFVALCNEYTHRYGKIHKTSRLIRPLSILPKNIPIGEITMPPQAMPDEYKNQNIVVAYRNYYINGKSHLAEWKNREIPEWYKPLDSSAG